MNRSAILLEKAIMWVFSVYIEQKNSPEQVYIALCVHIARKTERKQLTSTQKQPPLHYPTDAILALGQNLNLES